MTRIPLSFSLDVDGEEYKKWKKIPLKQRSEFIKNALKKGEGMGTEGAHEEEPENFHSVLKPTEKPLESASPSVRKSSSRERPYGETEHSVMRRRTS